MGSSRAYVRAFPGGASLSVSRGWLLIFTKQRYFGDASGVTAALVIALPYEAWQSAN